MVGSILASCSLEIIASLVEYIQHIEEQYSDPRSQSLDPTHWIKAILFGGLWSDGLTTWPWDGPVELSSRSKSIEVRTFS